MTWNLHHGDCLDRTKGLPALADGSVDHTITDPPYAGHVEAGSRSVGGKDKGGEITTRDFVYVPLSPAEQMAVSWHIARVTRRWGLVFTDVEGLEAWRHCLTLWGMEYVRCGIWERHGAPQTTGDRPAQGFEAIALFHAAGVRKRWNGRGKDGIWRHTLPSTKERRRRGHPTPKPEPLMAELVRDFTDPGETILDPYAGSAATGIAAVRAGRHFVGWEKKGTFYRLARAQLEVTRENLELFAPRRRRKAKQLRISE